MQRRAFLAATGGAAPPARGAAPRAQSWPGASAADPHRRALRPRRLGRRRRALPGGALSAALGVPVVVENRPGGGAVIGTDVVAKAAPDGHTLLMMSNTHTANETLLPNRPYVLLRDLAPVAAVNVAYHVLAVHPSLPARDGCAELIAHAEGQPGAAGLRLLRPRHALPHRRRGVLRHGRHPHEPRPLQGQQRGAHGADRGPGAGDVRRHPHHARADQRRARARPRHHRAGALRPAAGPAEPGGGGAGLRGLDLARPDGARRHAGADRGAAATRR